MTVIASIFIFLLTMGLIVTIQMNSITLKKKHIKKMTELQSIAANLLKNQNELSEKISIIDSFDAQYKTSREYLNQEILGLLQQFFTEYSKK